MPVNPTSVSPPWWFLVLLPLCAFTLVFAAFGPALRGEFLSWDDTQAVAQNKELRLEGKDGLAWRFTTMHMGHYQPLTWWSLSMDVADAPEGKLGDAEAARCHQTNLVLHALGAIVFGLLAERLLRAVFRESASSQAVALGALFASLFWALHPLRAESVAWITERRDVLSAIPLMCSIYMYVLWVEGRRRVFYFASLVFLLVSLLCKAWGMILPAILIVLDFYPLRRSAFSWRSLGAFVFEKAPFLVLSVGFGWIAVKAQALQLDAMPSFSEHTWFERALQACYGIVFYFWKSIVPSGLMPLYELPREISFGSARFLVPVLIVIVASVSLFMLRRKVPGLVAAVLASVILVAPVLGFAQSGPQLAADRYTYLFGLAFALLVAGAVIQWSRILRGIPWILGAVLLGLLIFATRAQASIWIDTQSLWSYVLAREPQHVVANLSLGNELARRAFESSSAQETARTLRQAEELFVNGLAASDDPRFATRIALLHDALSQIEPERAQEHRSIAAEYSERAVRLAIATGRVKPETRLEHAIQLLSLDRVDEALEELEWYAKQRPDDPRGESALKEARSRKKP